MSSPEIWTQKQLNETLEARIPAVAWHATVAILIEFNRALRQFGTGTLLKVADQFFVVTAAHVVRQEGFGTLVTFGNLHSLST